MAQWLTLASQQCDPDSIKVRCDMRVNLVDSRPAPKVVPCVLRFTYLHKNQHLQIPIRRG